MIESIKLESWAPDTDENNPSLILDSTNVYPVTRGVRTMIPTGGLASPSITAGTDITLYPTPTNIYTAYWSGGTSTRYILSQQMTAASSVAAGMSSVIFKGTLFADEAVIAHVNSGQTGEPATIPADPVWANAFALAYDYYGSFAQYGDYCLIATGDKLAYIEGSEPTVIKEDLSGDDLPDTGVNFTPMFLAQAGEFVYAACMKSSGADRLGVTMDSMYWVTSISGVINGTKPSFNPAAAGTNSQSARADDTPGPIIGMRALDRNVIIYKRKSVYLLTENGGTVYQQVISREVGPTGDQSVVDLGGRHVFMGFNDFYMVEGQGVQTLPNACREFMFGIDGDLDMSRMHGVRGQLDYPNTCVYWYYPSRGFIDYQPDMDDGKPICDSWVCWNFTRNSWTSGRLRYFKKVDSTKPYGQGVSAVCNPDLDLTESVTYSDIPDKVFNSATSKWNATPTPATMVWADSSLVSEPSRTSGVVAAVVYKTDDPYPNPNTADNQPLRRDTDTTYDTDLIKNNIRYVPLTSDSTSLRGRVRTGDFGDGVTFKFVRGVRPRFVGKDTPGVITCNVYVRQHLYEDWRLGTTSTVTQNMSVTDTPGSSGREANVAPFWFHIRSNSRYHQFEFIYNSQMEFSGYDIDYDDAGTR